MKQQENNNGNRRALTPQIQEPRLPYHPAVEDKFGIDKSGWKALVEAVFPAAQTPESVILALSYCKARSLDPFKRCIHIVPIWDKKKDCYVDTIWPGIGELRTTAFRTKAYAGRDKTSFGPDTTREWGRNERGNIKITFPIWAQVTVYRMICNQRVCFEGPPVFWEETFASTKGGLPNSMWQKRPRGQIEKCAEAAALRAAFPEELGDEPTADEAPMIYQHGSNSNSESSTTAVGVEGLKKRLSANADDMINKPEVSKSIGEDPEFEKKKQEAVDNLKAAEKKDKKSKKSKKMAKEFEEEIVDQPPKSHDSSENEESALQAIYKCSRCDLTFTEMPEKNQCTSCFGEILEIAKE